MEARTAQCTRMHLRVAIDYSSKAALQEAFARVSAGEGEWPGDPLLPNVDLLLRTGGERRLSDFLLWECAYAELAFVDALFPDLTTSDLDAVFADFVKRDRRFGGLNAVPVPVGSA
ncbi:undecaprenyl diphosphate synthase family protein [Gemmatimonas sp.]|uniref:undecaprenyl diphosphate synthase family protein n=1 Tax=Gemmatimonas sp. TaxID=1962908 RepID=UPI00391EF6F6